LLQVSPLGSFFASRSVLLPGGFFPLRFSSLQLGSSRWILLPSGVLPLGCFSLPAGFFSSVLPVRFSLPLGSSGIFFMGFSSGFFFTLGYSSRLVLHQPEVFSQIFFLLGSSHRFLLFLPSLLSFSSQCGLEWVQKTNIPNTFQGALFRTQDTSQYSRHLFINRQVVAHIKRKMFR